MEYEEFLELIGMDDAKVLQLMALMPDPVVPFSDTIYPMFSTIQGIGLASYASYLEGDKVMNLLIGGEREVGARYSNHSATPNLEAVLAGQYLVAVATRNIPAGEELTMCYSDNLKKSLEYDEAREVAV